jgi:alkylated DNA repair dioxygenase AlkB
MTDLQVVRKWHTDPVLLDAVRGLFAYGPNDDRATGIVYGEGNNWPDSLKAIGPLLLSDLHSLLGISYEIVAFQAYMDGAGCGWHQDSPFDAQAVLSLGVTRTFGVKPLDGEPQYVSLEHGDLVVMPSGFQDSWQHCVPVEDVPGERCSLVFRTVNRGQ